MHAHIETERLMLREFREKDAIELHKICNQDYILQWMPDWKLSVESLRELIKWFKQCYSNIYSSDIRVMLAVTLKTNSKLIGMVGIGPKKEVKYEIEVAYYISKEFCNQGYITEAIKALTEWVFENTEIEYLIAIIEPKNLSSQRVIEKCGFTNVDTKMILNSGERETKPFFYYRLYNKQI